MRPATAAATPAFASIASFAAFAAVALLATEAGATALAMPTPTDSGPPTTLAALGTLSVDATLTPSGADVTERRTYSLTTLYTGRPTTLTYYHSLTGEPGGAAPRVVIAGQVATGRTLAPAEADAVRRQLTIAIGDPAPLRELGTPLYVTDAMAVMVPGPRPES